MVIPWKLISTLRFWPVSQTSLWNGSLQNKKFCNCWYWQISWSATVPSQKQCSFWVLSALGACLTLCESGICPQEAPLRLDNLLLFALCASIPISEFSSIFILILWPVVIWPGKCLGVSSDGTSPGPAAVFPAARAP